MSGTSDAYWDPTRFGRLEHWDFAVRSCAPPIAESPPGGINSAAYQAGENLALGAPYFVSEVDAFKANSYSGTKGQAGNVREWFEDWRSRGDAAGQTYGTH